MVTRRRVSKPEAVPVSITGIQGAPFFEVPGPDSQPQQHATVKAVPLETELKYVYETLRETVAESGKLKGRLQKTEESLVSAFTHISTLNSELFELKKRNAQLAEQLDDCKGERDSSLREAMEQQQLLDQMRTKCCNTIYTKLDEMRKVIRELEFVRYSSDPSDATQGSKARQVLDESEESIAEEGRTPVVASRMNPVVLLERCVPTDAQLRRANINSSGSTSSPSQEDAERGSESNHVDAGASCTSTKMKPRSSTMAGGNITTRSKCRKRSLRQSTQRQSRRKH